MGKCLRFIENFAVVVMESVSGNVRDVIRPSLKSTPNVEPLFNACQVKETSIFNWIEEVIHNRLRVIMWVNFV
jgi:hypothetical protein